MVPWCLLTAGLLLRALLAVAVSRVRAIRIIILQVGPTRFILMTHDLREVPVLPETVIHVLLLCGRNLVL